MQLPDEPPVLQSDLKPNGIQALRRCEPRRNNPRLTRGLTRARVRSGGPGVEASIPVLLYLMPATQPVRRSLVQRRSSLASGAGAESRVVGREMSPVGFSPGSVARQRGMLITRSRARRTGGTDEHGFE